MVTAALLSILEPAIPPATPIAPPIIVPLITLLTGMVLFFIFKPSYLSVGALTNLLIESLAKPIILSTNPFSTGFGSFGGISTTLSFSCIFSIYFCTSSGLKLGGGGSGGFITSGSGGFLVSGFGFSFMGCSVIGS